MTTGKLAVPALGVAATVLAVWLVDARLADIGDGLDARRGRVGTEIARLEARNERIRDDMRFADRHAADIAALEAAGFTAPQDRLAVSTAIEALATRHGLTRLRLTMRPQAAVSAGAHGARVPSLHATPVEITAEARRGPDLLAFLDALPGAFTGAALVTRLSLRAPEGLSDSPVTVEAEISWLTLPDTPAR